MMGEQLTEYVAKLETSSRSYSIDDWKRKLGYSYDHELATAIGVDRSTISVARKKGLTRPVHKLLALMYAAKP